MYGLDDPTLVMQEELDRLRVEVRSLRAMKQRAERIAVEPEPGDSISIQRWVARRMAAAEIIDASHTLVAREG